MRKPENPFNITKPILISCLVLILLILVSCSKENMSNAEKVSRVNISEKTFVDNSKSVPENSNYTKPENSKDKVYSEVSSFSRDNTYEDLSNIKNTYYGKYTLEGEDVLGNFEVNRNSIVFVPDNGHSTEVIHFNGIKNINRVDHPNGLVDIILQFDNDEKVIKGVSDYMFSDILLYTTK